RTPDPGKGKPSIFRGARSKARSSSARTTTATGCNTTARSPSDDAPSIACHRREEADAVEHPRVRVPPVFGAGRRAGRASAEGLLGGYVGAEPKPRQRGAH